MRRGCLTTPVPTALLTRTAETQDYETDRALINATLPARDVSETFLPPFIGLRGEQVNCICGALSPHPLHCYASGCAAAAQSAAVMTSYYAVQLLPDQERVNACAFSWSKAYRTQSHS